MCASSRALASCFHSASRWPMHDRNSSFSFIHVRRAAAALIGIITLSQLAACYSMRPSNGGGQATFESPRKAVAADVAVPPGYTVEVIATGLTFPTGVAFDD